jgi:hypothetical protein
MRGGKRTRVESEANPRFTLSKLNRNRTRSGTPVSYISYTTSTIFTTEWRQKRGSPPCDANRRATIFALRHDRRTCGRRQRVARVHGSVVRTLGVVNSSAGPQQPGELNRKGRAMEGGCGGRALLCDAGERHQRHRPRLEKMLYLEGFLEVPTDFFNHF